MNIPKLCVISIIVSTGMLLALAPSKAQFTVPPDKADFDGDGLVDEVSSREDVRPDKSYYEAHQTQQTGSVSIGMIETGGYGYARNRLTTLGYSVTLIPPTSGMGTFREYDIVYLPTNWAQAVEVGGIIGDYETIEAHASDYRNYVHEGGSLFIGQPNPYGQPDSQVIPTLLPYSITFYNSYEEADYPPTVVDPNHYITSDLAPEELPFPADQMTTVDPFYHTLVVGRSTGSASLAIGEYGEGRILVQTAHPSYSAIHVFSDEAYVRMIEWVRGTGYVVYLPLVLR